uniref:Uncharacterized protein n=1 Tax=Oryza nivara TaxID=4536 RepID=A0A0E0FS95_ORYNI
MSHIFWARILRPTVEVDVRVCLGGLVIHIHGLDRPILFYVTVESAWNPRGPHLSAWPRRAHSLFSSSPLSLSHSSLFSEASRPTTGAEATGARQESRRRRRLRRALRAGVEKSRALNHALAGRGPSLGRSRRGGVVPDHAPRDTLEGAGEYINRAVGPAVAVRGLEPPFLAASAVADDLLGYLVVLSRLEEALHFLSDNCGIASQWLSFAEYLGDRSLADPCFVSDLAEVLSHLKTPSANLDGGLLVAALDILEDEFCRLLKEHSASLAMKEPNYSRPRLHLRAHCRGRSAPPPPLRPTPRCPPARGRFTGGGDTARRRHSQPAAALAFSCIAAAAVTSSPASL